MKKKINRREDELNRLYNKLDTLEPGTEEYNKVLEEVIKVENVANEGNQTKSNKIDLWIKIGGIVATTIAVPLIKYGLNRSMVKHIGTIEQMETFTSTAGRRMIPDMFERN